MDSQSSRTNSIGSAGEVPSLTVGGVRIDALSMEGAVRAILDPERSGAVHLCNAYTISLATKDVSLRQRLNRGALNLIDGMPLLWLARRRGFRDLNDRVSGADIMASCLDLGRATQVRHYLYGSTPDVVGALRASIETRWPGVQVVAAESPPFREFSDEEVAETVRRIEDTGANVVWVGLGTPKQDVEVDRMSAIGGATFVAIGAAFDFLAGKRRRAPMWLQKSGLEWVYRLALEPRRLWKRYLLGNLRFVVAVLRSS